MGRGRSAAISTSPLALRGLPRRGEDLARARARGPARPRQHEDPSLPHRRGDQSQAARRRSSCHPVGHLGVSSRREGSTVRLSCPHTPNRPSDDCRRLILHAPRTEIVFFNSPMVGKVRGHTQGQTAARYAYLAADSVQVAVEQVVSSIAPIRNGGPARIAGALTPARDDIAGAGATTSRTCQAGRGMIRETWIRTIRAVDGARLERTATGVEKITSAVQPWRRSSNRYRRYRPSPGRPRRMSRREGARQRGATTPVSASQAAEDMNVSTRAGFDLDQAPASVGDTLPPARPGLWTSEAPPPSPSPPTSWRTSVRRPMTRGALSTCWLFFIILTTAFAAVSREGGNDEEETAAGA